jgi:hypothetical protein
LLLSLIAPCCATLASEAGDSDAVRPNAGAGPFRVVTDDELGTATAPYVLRLKAPAYREPSALAQGAGTPGEVALYAVAEISGVHGIYRFVAPDGRSFGPAEPSTAVIAPTEPWEGALLSDPEIVRIGGEIWIYYAAEGGIGLARSSDGVTFEKLAAPVLAPASGGWDDGATPSSPGHLELRPGEHRLFYAAMGAIGEARSPDGLAWERLSEPVLEPAPAAPDDPPFDEAAVGDPEPVLAESAEGRRIVRVYYSGSSADGGGAIGLAARFGDSGPLERAALPALSTPRRPRDPALLPLGEVSLLYFTQQAGSGAAQDYPALALAVAPATFVLPSPEPEDP